MNRRKSRELTMRLLFQMTINKEDFKEVIDNLKENLKVDNNESELLSNLKTDKSDEENMDLTDIDMSYVTRVLKGIQEKKGELDDGIEKCLIKWKINRISRVDLAILRICTYEFLYEDNIPKNVSINEAIELAKKYSGDKSAAFVNGILGKMIKNKE
ncbi:transcription antitermination factor NusB [Clostridium fermenticellae]|uniref:Transcription antitermination protein NusB n=1 Tax=Clostridium fermenticellae TaxID=2068654 RepID=A0A386H4G4_9CLOT|nr:transcription antitermination factor NusB [Clostridium fermenticellae]AYD40592.1 transcription antitermination factor NusB [Clostridium fermenticellae]